MKSILVTGGAGYIGSHTCVALLNEGYHVVIFDNLSNADKRVLGRIEAITGKAPEFIEGDMLNAALLDKLFSEYDFDAVIHFAGLKAVGESVSIPLAYYHNNLTGTLKLLDAMKKHDVKRMVFSSSATVYGMNNISPLTEDMPLSATNPYGWTKLMIEQILRDLCTSDNNWHIAILRYFNPIGAHESGLIGENPSGIPNNLMPYVTQVAVGKRKSLGVFGDDYNTPDGTGVRDYIHVVDLALGHLAALEKLSRIKGAEAYNLGTGNGYSVLDVLHAFEKASGVKIPYEIQPRRPGDIDVCYADASKANTELKWRTVRDMQAMCRDAWRWQKNNPNGYED